MDGSGILEIMTAWLKTRRMEEKEEETTVEEGKCDEQVWGRIVSEGERRGRRPYS